MTKSVLWTDTERNIYYKDIAIKNNACKKKAWAVWVLLCDTVTETETELETDSETVTETVPWSY